MSDYDAAMLALSRRLRRQALRLLAAAERIPEDGTATREARLAVVAGLAALEEIGGKVAEMGGRQ